MARNTIVLRLDDVSKSFAKAEHDGVTHALNGVSPSTKDGEFIDLVEPSSCGRSTILHLMAGLTLPTIGHLTVSGAQITGPSPERGMMFQKSTLSPWLTVEKNIPSSLKLQGRLKGSEERVERALKITDLESFRNDYPDQFSSGMTQYVPLVRSLTNEPDILLLNEPLGVLGVFTRMNMQDEVLEVWQEKKQLATVVIHDAGKAVYMGTRVVVTGVHPGRVVPDIRTDQIHPRERSSQIFVACRDEIFNRLHFDGRDGGQR